MKDFDLSGLNKPEADLTASLASDEEASLEGRAEKVAHKIAVIDEAKDEILSVMETARQEAESVEETVSVEPKDSGHDEAPLRGDGSWLRFLSLLLVWTGLALALAAAAATVLSPEGSASAGWALIAGASIIFALFIGAGALRLFSPLLVASTLLRQAAGDRPARAGQLAGADTLSALKIAEKILDTDREARLITRANGVVLYANAAYQALAKEAGVRGLAGLPPRIDRLFAGQGAEATKLFRLCRAASTGQAASETVSQLIGLSGGGVRRRFEVSLMPLAGASDYISWRVCELPEEEEQQDALAAAYADFTEPVLGLERSGQIAWANAAMRGQFGVSRGALHHIDDVVLGESAALISALWRADQDPVTARIRQVGGDPVDAVFRGFRRGGVGEGFVCVALERARDEGVEEEVSVGGEVRDAPFGVAVIEGEIGRDARIAEANKAFTDVFGGGKKNAPLAKCLPAQALEDLAAEIKRKANAGGSPRAIEAVIGEGASADHYAFFARPVKRRRGSYGVRRTLLYSVDITDRKRMEQDYAQDQKLKAIGHVAGGVAHDFNNLLQVILGNCEHLMLRHPAGDPAYQELVLIRENAQRAANLTKQLLAYSRKQTLTRKVQSITDILLDFSRFLNRAVGEKVKLNLVNGRGLPSIKVDRNQLETAIMNLAVNARDAMAPDGGMLTIKTQFIDAAAARNSNVTGLDGVDHVLIEVSDTGPGVPQEIADKIFDPFFTTKEEGKGTGLGLSTVHGVIGQMGGTIALDNLQEGGARFRIYLPAAAQDDEDDEPVLAPPPVAADYTGSGRILVVEDEDPVRAFVVAALERSGYDVTSVGDGVDALELLQEEDDDFDLLISDIMMPEVDGPTLVERARAECDFKAAVIFMSGYAETAVREQLDKIDDAGYLQKPFPMAALGAQVKASLEAHAAAKS